MIKTGVIGHPVKHSKSPLIHNYWIEKHGLSGKYEAIDIKPENLKEDIQKLIDQGYKGFNLTLPHKELIIPLCDEIDDTARKIGAVNTVVVEKGKLKGFNTDVFGFIENIKQNAKYNFSGAAYIIGAGGAAKAVLYGLEQEGTSKIYLTNRTKFKAEELAAHYKNVSVIDWEKREQALSNADLVINTTSLGMTGQEKLDPDLSALKPDAIVCDIVYTPLYTDLLRHAQDKGNRVVTGIGMLLHQARPAFQKWHGVMPDIDETLLKKVLA